MIETGEPRSLGVSASEARLRFTTEYQKVGGGPRRRLLALDGEPAFELSFYCGSCPLLFRRLEGSNETLSLEAVRERLTGTLGGLADDGVPDVLHAFGALLPAGRYLPMLLDVEPRLVLPGQQGDYFSDEQVSTWGLDQFWGLPEHPRTPYYRTFETAVDADAHLYEFVVPMVPPIRNDRDRVADYARLMERGTVPTAVAISTLDVCQPALDLADDYFVHWGLTHFLLDGHHKVEAAATAGRPVRLLSLLALDESLAGAEDRARLAAVRARPRTPRVVPG
ncbi:hypothetical protein [Streptomyces sp. NPDC097619]|uniref:hypothetical protein n=1 Tax=Streptomyces sp. NPDC097619 TaxID=3157228 RepID=UPI00331E33C5